MEITHKQKYEWLVAMLGISPQTYAESFRFEVMCEIESMGPENPGLKRALEKLETEDDIRRWVDKVLSRLVMSEGKMDADVIIHEWLDE